MAYLSEKSDNSRTSFLPLSISSSGGEQVLYAEGTGVFDTLPGALIYKHTFIT